MRKTLNYENLTENIKTNLEAFKLAYVTFHPSVIIERCSNLMAIFAEMYMDTNESRTNLIEDLRFRPQIVSSIFFTIFEQLKEVEAMMLECQEFKVAGEKCEESREVI